MIHSLLQRENIHSVVALLGNPNVGKSTIFNCLTGGNQHTGNWPGKTVGEAKGILHYKGKEYEIVDLPGTYSLCAHSEEERVTAEFLQSDCVRCTVVVADATCLERNLVLVQQVMELTDHVVLCVNLMDEAVKKEIAIDLPLLEMLLGIPVVGTSAGKKEGLDLLTEQIRKMCDGFSASIPKRLLQKPEMLLDRCSQRKSDEISELFAAHAKELSKRVVYDPRSTPDEPTDRWLLSSVCSYILLILGLLAVFWLTIKGANYPSECLQWLFAWLENKLVAVTSEHPWWLRGLLVDGVYQTVSSVISVMLPPMAIFFPLFTLLEDLGVLPRAAFLLDRPFEHCGSCGKQALTMAMGFGCNAAGVVGCRIIATKRERFLAILTNALVPCNGRFPALITLCSVFVSKNGSATALVLSGVIVLSVLVTLFATKLLGRFVFDQAASEFVLEIPPYRRPRLGQILIRSWKDRTVYVLIRAVSVSAPCGAVIWMLQQIQVKGLPLLQLISIQLDPVGQFLGMNGALLLAFLLSFPANELLLPMVVLIHQGELSGVTDLQAWLLTQNWGIHVAVCTMMFILFHWPCSTTCLMIRKETGSWRWVMCAMAVPTMIGAFLCSLLAAILRS